MGFTTSFLYSFAFLEVVPKFKCFDTGNPDPNNYRICDSKEICNDPSIKWDYMWEDQETIDNLIVQLDLKCEDEIVIGLFGSCFLAGIVLGSVTITRIGDIYGRRPAFMIGLAITSVVTFLFLINKSYHVAYLLCFVLGFGITGK